MGGWAHGPCQSNGMCFAELTVQPNLWPNASTSRIVDFPQVTSCGPGPVSLPGAFIIWGYLPALLVGPISAFAHALTLPAISQPQEPRSGAISQVMLARSTPMSLRPSANSSATRAGDPPTRPPMI